MDKLPRGLLTALCRQYGVVGVKDAHKRYYNFGWPLIDAVSLPPLPHGYSRDGTPTGCFIKGRVSTNLIRALAREHGQPYERVKERMRKREGKVAWSLKRALTTPPLSASETNRDRVYISRPHPNSITTLARRHGKKRAIVAWRVRNGMSLRRALTTPLRPPSEIAAICAETGLKYATVYRRKRMGASDAEMRKPLQRESRR